MNTSVSLSENMNSFEKGNGFFPDDVVDQILARLPIKSLFRFKCVCKFWYRLPSNKYFIQLYNEISLRNPMVLVEILKSVYIKSNFICTDSLSCFSEFSLDFLSDRVKVRASCNGLLCCASIPNRGVYYVCNPMTREFRMLPSRERPVSRYHPDDEATLVGLAVDPYTQKYNVVLAGFYRPFGRRPLDCLVCVVFNSETNTWKRFISSAGDGFTHMNRNQVVFASGSLHWLTISCLYILVLDLYSEVWKKIPLPGEIVNSYGRGNRIYLLELEGAVSVIQISADWMSIWVLKDYVREEWLLADRVSLRCIKAFIPSAFPISQNRDFVFLATQRQILIYGRRNKVWKELYSVRTATAYPLWFSAHAFRSTLFSCRQNLEYC
ncbi:F-box protein [Cinnamomum micranthum f. kanehirae]|uniref:F-box protein n=1 Tax=Cinnamomum micranthum f. kanehirae TaxID=337451 RepID=A0A3S4NF73_9MAGN|nr:F-box protein [Cinnamomum micranthum f. kanehirae]